MYWNHYFYEMHHRSFVVIEKTVRGECKRATFYSSFKFVKHEFMICTDITP